MRTHPPQPPERHPSFISPLGEGGLSDAVHKFLFYQKKKFFLKKQKKKIKEVKRDKVQELALWCSKLNCHLPCQYVIMGNLLPIQLSPNANWKIVDDDPCVWAHAARRTTQMDFQIPGFGVWPRPGCYGPKESEPTDAKYLCLSLSPSPLLYLSNK